MTDRFSVISPHNGIRVHCSEKNWAHVLDGHPEFLGQEKVVEGVLRDPLAVYEDGEFSDRHLFYRPSELLTPNDRGYVLVIVGYANPMAGAVISAYNVARAKEGGDKVIWSRGDPPLSPPKKPRSLGPGSRN